MIAGGAGQLFTPEIEGSAFMRDLSKEEVDFIRLQMLYNLTNGWSWYAYKRVGPEEIINLELEMWDEQLPPAVDILLQLVQPEGSDIEKIKHVLEQVSSINGYEPEYLEETPGSLKWEYKTCPNWNAIEQLGYGDYLSLEGEPARVSCIHGCTRVHEIYFRKIAPGIELKHFELRPDGNDTCVFEVSI
jgi:hypothetical protein